MRKRRGTAEGAKLITVEDVCARYSVGANTARKLMKDSGCAVRFGKCLRVDVAKLDKVVEELYGV